MSIKGLNMGHRVWRSALRSFLTQVRDCDVEVAVIIKEEASNKFCYLVDTPRPNVDFDTFLQEFGERRHQAVEMMLLEPPEPRCGPSIPTTPTMQSSMIDTTTMDTPPINYMPEAEPAVTGAQPVLTGVHPAVTGAEVALPGAELDCKFQRKRKYTARARRRPIIGSCWKEGCMGEVGLEKDGVNFYQRCCACYAKRTLKKPAPFAEFALFKRQMAEADMDFNNMPSTSKIEPQFADTSLLNIASTAAPPPFSVTCNLCGGVAQIESIGGIAHPLSRIYRCQEANCAKSNGPINEYVPMDNVHMAAANLFNTELDTTVSQAIGFDLVPDRNAMGVRLCLACNSKIAVVQTSSAIKRWRCVRKRCSLWYGFCTEDDHNEADVNHKPILNPNEVADSAMIDIPTGVAPIVTPGGKVIYPALAPRKVNKKRSQIKGQTPIHMVRTGERVQASISRITGANRAEGGVKLCQLCGSEVRSQSLGERKQRRRWRCINMKCRQWYSALSDVELAEYYRKSGKLEETNTMVKAQKMEEVLGLISNCSGNAWPIQEAGAVAQYAMGNFQALIGDTSVNIGVEEIDEPATSCPSPPPQPAGGSISAIKVERSPSPE